MAGADIAHGARTRGQAFFGGGAFLTFSALVVADALAAAGGTILHALSTLVRRLAVLDAAKVRGAGKASEAFADRGSADGFAVAVFLAGMAGLAQHRIAAEVRHTFAAAGAVNAMGTGGTFDGGAGDIGHAFGAFVRFDAVVALGAKHVGAAEIRHAFGTLVCLDAVRTLFAEDIVAAECGHALTALFAVHAAEALRALDGGAAWAGRFLLGAPAWLCLAAFQLAVGAVDVFRPGIDGAGKSEKGEGEQPSVVFHDSLIRGGMPWTFARCVPASVSAPSCWIHWLAVGGRADLVQLALCNTVAGVRAAYSWHWRPRGAERARGVAGFVPSVAAAVFASRRQQRTKRVLGQRIPTGSLATTVWRWVVARYRRNGLEGLWPAKH